MCKYTSSDSEQEWENRILWNLCIRILQVNEQIATLWLLLEILLPSTQSKAHYRRDWFFNPQFTNRETETWRKERSPGKSMRLARHNTQVSQIPVLYQ